MIDEIEEGLAVGAAIADEALGKVSRPRYPGECRKARAKLKEQDVERMRIPIAFERSSTPCRRVDGAVGSGERKMSSRTLM